MVHPTPPPSATTPKPLGSAGAKSLGKGQVVTIDGPSASGKSSVAKAVAQRLGLGYLNSGQVYRFCAAALAEQQVPIDDELAVITAIRRFGEELSLSGEGQLLWQQQPVSTDLERQEVGNRASIIAAIAGVREILLPIQRKLAESCPNGIITDGRDMGTVVFPDAVAKVFLVASAEARAKRRYDQLEANGQLHPDMTLSQLISEIEERDARDKNRPISPLKAADDAVLIDATELNFDEVVAEVIAHVSKL